MIIRGLGYDNQSWVLVNKHGDTVEEEYETTDFRGDTMVIIGGRPPHKPSSSGFIFTEGVDGGQGEFYPSVCDLSWIHVVNEGEA